RAGGAPCASARSLPRHRRIPAVRVPLQHRRAAVPHRARARPRRPVPRDLAAPADDHLYPRDRSFARCKHLCNDRDHALRVLAMNDDQGRGERRAQLVVAGAIALGVVIRLLAVRAQGFPTDVGTFEAWAERLAAVGPGRFYEPGYFSDYPPGFLYVLWLLGALFDGELLRLAVKAISIPADIGIALLAARVLWRTAGRSAAVVARGRTRRGRRPREAAVRHRAPHRRGGCGIRVHPRSAVAPARRHD